MNEAHGADIPDEPDDTTWLHFTSGQTPLTAAHGVLDMTVARNSTHQLMFTSPGQRPATTLPQYDDPMIEPFCFEATGIPPAQPATPPQKLGVFMMEIDDFESNGSSGAHQGQHLGTTPSPIPMELAQARTIALLSTLGDMHLQPILPGPFLSGSSQSHSPFLPPRTDLHPYSGVVSFHNGVDYSWPRSAHSASLGPPATIFQAAPCQLQRQDYYAPALQQDDLDERSSPVLKKRRCTDYPASA